MNLVCIFVIVNIAVVDVVVVVISSYNRRVTCSLI
jgi:hypothetical protein